MKEERELGVKAVVTVEISLDPFDNNTNDIELDEEETPLTDIPLDGSIAAVADRESVKPEKEFELELVKTL